MSKRNNLKEILSYSKKLNVLYVEDNSQNIEAAKPLFEDLFSSVVVGRNGREGIKLYQELFDETGDYFDLIITDIQMPNFNGINMIKHIYGINNKQKILVISAYQTEEYLVPLINLRVDGFIRKPLSLEQILDQLASLYSNIRGHIIALPHCYSYDFHAKKLLKEGEEITLTKKEVRLLELFLSNSESYFSTQEIFVHLFFDEPFKEFSANSLHGILKRLRAKVSYEIITNNRTLGYRITMAENQP